MDKTNHRFHLTLIFIGSVLVWSFCTSSVFSQEAGVSPGTMPLQRARNLATPPPSATEGIPAPASTQDDYRRRFEAAAPPVPGTEPAAPGAPGQAPPKEEKRYTVYYGVHEWCVKCGLELRKPKRKEVPESELSGYYDDGTHGDAVAGDGIYSNITEERDRLCDQDWDQLQKLQRLIGIAQKDSPVEFYMVNAATEDPQSNPPSPIPTYGYWTTQRADFLNDYTARVLTPFKDPITGKFYEHFKFSPEELLAMAIEQQRQRQQQKQAATGMPAQNGGGPRAPIGAGQSGMYQSSYFGERQNGGSFPQ